MTYCVGLRTSKAAIIVADSVTTGRDCVWQFSTPFAEAVQCNSDGLVADRYCKIARLGETLFCFAGNVPLGRSIGTCLRDELFRGATPLSAFNTSIASNRPFPRGQRVETLFAWYDDAGPHLLVYRGPDGGGTREVEFAQIGSAGERWQRLTSAVLTPIRQESKALNEFRVTDGRSLTAILTATMQCYGFYDAVLGDQFGGAIVGAYVDNEGSHWQGEHLFIQVCENNDWCPYAIIGIYDECLVSWSTMPECKFERGLKLLPNILGDYSAAPPSLRISNRACQIMHTFTPDYIICYASPPRRNVAILEMRSYPASDAVSIGSHVDVPEIGKRAFAVPIRLSATVDQHLQTPTKQETLSTLIYPLTCAVFRIPARLLWLPCGRQPVLGEADLKEADEVMSWLRTRGRI